MTNNQQNINIPRYRSLEKHVYPLWVKILFNVILLLFLLLIPRFLWNEFPVHMHVASKIKCAEQCFLNKEYEKSAPIYNALLNEYPNYKRGKIRLAQTIFAVTSSEFHLSEEDRKYMYFSGIDLLKGETYNDSEIKELLAYVPKEYLETVKSFFKPTRTKRY